jgi:hypothetical protein
MEAGTFLVSPSFQLTPIRQKRNKRPSYSRVKQRRPEVSLSQRAVTTSTEKKPEEQPGIDIGIAGANLEFKEFSFKHPDGTFHNIKAKQLDALLAYLDEKYGVYEIWISGIFLILTCRDEAPPSDSRPFTIAGCIAVWLSADDNYPFGLLSPDLAEGEDLKIPDHMASDLRQYTLPKFETLAEFWEEFHPEALQIQYYVTGIIVELPRVSDEEHRARLNNLPRHFENTAATLHYTNGFRALTEFARPKKPQPRFLDGEEDDTDYIVKMGFASPGVVISSAAGAVTAGILVQKDGRQRLTTAVHRWDEELDTIPEKFGNPDYFKVIQGNTHIGHVAERIGTTDIGLAKLNDGITFTNRFLDIPASAKSLLALADMEVGDEFMIDSFVIGVQRLSCLGCILQRIGDGREKTFIQKRDVEGKLAPLPGDGRIMFLRQGIFATSAPEINACPQVREGACGAALIRCKKSPEIGMLTETLAKGEIGGFMHWADLQRKSTMPGELVCVTDCLDDLVEEGWGVVPVTDKRAVSDVEPGDDEAEVHK